MFYLDLFDHKSRGIFSLLNDECKIAQPNVQNFTTNLRSIYENQKSDTIDPNLKAIHWLHSPENAFVIRHFAGNVRYTTVKPFLII